MICHIVQNGGYMFLILCLCMIVVNGAILEQTLTVQEFCSGNLFMHNIEPGEPYILNLKSDPSSGGINKLYHRLSKRKCRQEFKTSDAAAHFEVSITNMNITSCPNCRCNYFEISVFGHSKRFCGYTEDFFSSKSDKLVIDFYPGLGMSFDVTFTFSVQRNLYIITGTQADASVPINFIETPYFPLSYPPNYRAEYIIRSGNADVHVMLLFLDFLISRHSFIEVTENNGTHFTRFYGNLFRPPAIVSQSDELSLKFESNDQRDMPGFRAEVWFIKSVDHLFVPYTDCSGPKVGRDGNLHIKPHEGFGLYDCLWHIMPSVISTELNLSVRVHLRDIGHKSNLEFRHGRYSKSAIVQKIDCEVENCTFLNIETVVPASDFFIRFSGYLDEYSVVNISYSTYRVGNCSNEEFRCNDGRCLLLDYQCDGVKQCPDGLDEATCPSLDVLEDEVSLHPSVPTKSYHSDAIHTKFVYVVILGGAGLVTVLVAVFISFCKRCQQTSAAAGQILPEQVVAGELSPVQPSLYAVNSYDCDRPPSYEDFIKSSDNYPPLLYTRTNQHFIPNAGFVQCTTTSFCTGARVRHYSVDSSFNIRSSDTGSDIFLNITGDDSHLTQPLSFNKCNIEINQNLRFEASKSMKRTYSLDSKLGDLVNKNSYNFSLSIIHPVCANLSNNLPHVQCNTLPSNFKMNEFKTSSCNRPQVDRSAYLHCNSCENFPKDRRFTYSFVSNGSVKSEIVTTVKTRCCSDPCNGISVHCSLN